MTVGAPHIPVMLNEVLEALQPKAGEVYVDGTFGAGGYTRAILEAADCQVIAIDRDESAIKRAEAMVSEGYKITPVHGAFGDVRAHLAAIGVDKVDGFVMDLGVSSMQIDTPERGFSFMRDGALDMRMDVSTGEPASVMIARVDEGTLANIIFEYGEERHARRIARAIVSARAQAPIETTLQLAEIIAGAVPGAKKYAIHPATRSFQALRIAVNDEMGQLREALEASREVLHKNGRLVVVSFHSLEDAFVKRFMRSHAVAPSVSRYVPQALDNEFKPEFILKNNKAVLPTDEECEANIRARSARLRAAIKT